MLKMSKLKEAIPSIKIDQAKSYFKVLAGGILAGVGASIAVANAYQVGVDETLIKAAENLKMDE